jgi:hypothetical protein
LLLDDGALAPNGLVEGGHVAGGERGISLAMTVQGKRRASA